MEILKFPYKVMWNDQALLTAIVIGSFHSTFTPSTISISLHTSYPSTYHICKFKVCLIWQPPLNIHSVNYFNNLTYFIYINLLYMEISCLPYMVIFHFTFNRSFHCNCTKYLIWKFQVCLIWQPHTQHSLHQLFQYPYILHIHQLTIYGNFMSALYGNLSLYLQQVFLL